MPKLQEIIGEDVFKQLPEEVKTKYAEIDLVDKAGHVTKEKYQQEVEAAKGLQSQISERDKQIEGFKKTLGGKSAEDIVKEIEQSQAANKTATENYEKQLAEQRKQFALEIALRDAKAKNSKAVLGLLKLEEITMDGETLKGLDGQLEALKKSDAYLFDDEPTGGSGSLGNHPRNPNTKPEAAVYGKMIGEQANAAQNVPENPYFK